MKAFASLLLAVGISAAIDSEDNNCIFEEGATRLWAGTGFYMNLKDEFIMPGKGSCNVIAHSNVQVDWLSSMIKG
jgi:hypothetical protein